jgi:hypothetical protein
MGPARIVPLRRYTAPKELVQLTQRRLSALDLSARQALEEQGYQGFVYLLMEHASKLHALVTEVTEAANQPMPAADQRALQNLLEHAQELLKTTRALMRGLDEKP